MKLDRIFPWATAYFGILAITSSLFAIAGGVAVPNAPSGLLEVLYKTSLFTGIGALLAALLALASVILSGGHRLISAGSGAEGASPQDKGP